MIDAPAGALIEQAERLTILPSQGAIKRALFAAALRVSSVIMVKTDGADTADILTSKDH
jgi:hypothetical protein